MMMMVMMMMMSLQEIENNRMGEAYILCTLYSSMFRRL